jgi:hypothetical protein
MSASESFGESLRRLLIWGKGTRVQGKDPSKWRADAYGTLMFFDDYGKRHSVYGWEYDHIVSWGGNDLNNLQPMNWLNNVRKSNKVHPFSL